MQPTQRPTIQRQPPSAAEIAAFRAWVQERVQQGEADYAAWLAAGCPADHPLYGRPDPTHRPTPRQSTFVAEAEQEAR